MRKCHKENERNHCDLWVVIFQPFSFWKRKFKATVSTRSCDFVRRKTSWPDRTENICEDLSLNSLWSGSWQVSVSGGERKMVVVGCDAGCGPSLFCMKEVFANYLFCSSFYLFIFVFFCSPKLLILFDCAVFIVQRQHQCKKSWRARSYASTQECSSYAGENCTKSRCCMLWWFSVSITLHGTRQILCIWKFTFPVCNGTLHKAR